MSKYAFGLYSPDHTTKWGGSETQTQTKELVTMRRCGLVYIRYL